LKEILNLIIQSKVKDSDIEEAIRDSKLKPTYTPCAMLKKGVSPHLLEKLICLEKQELSKVFLLLLSLFKIAYLRRYLIEKNLPSKWWYWDLSNEKNVETILSHF